MTTIASLQPGQEGIIQSIEDESMPVKLMELGCLPGNLVKLVQIAPLGDPLYINMNGSHIAIRKSMASRIPLEILDETATL